MRPRVNAKKLLRFGLTALLFVLIGGALGWSANRVFLPGPVLKEDDFILAKSEWGSIEGSMSVNISASWGSSPIANNLRAGTVTFVHQKPPGDYSPGDRIYDINLSPIVVIEGDTPAFRTMQVGDEGADILQLKKFLINEGYLEPADDSVWRWWMTDAVKSWQREAGMPADGVIDLGEVLFLPEFSGKLILDPSIIYVGASLMGGEPSVLSLDQEPRLVIAATDRQANRMPVGTRVEIYSSEDSLAAEVREISPLGSRQFDVFLGAVSDSNLCEHLCPLIPTDGTEVLLGGNVITQEKVDGLVIPSSAIQSNNREETFVVNADGEDIKVKVLGGADGLSVVTGIKAGVEVRVISDPIT